MTCDYSFLELFAEGPSTTCADGIYKIRFIKKSNLLVILVGSRWYKNWQNSCSVKVVTSNKQHKHISPTPMCANLHSQPCPQQKYIYL